MTNLKKNDQFFKMADTLRDAAPLKFDVMELETQTSKSSISNMFLKTMTLSCFFLVSLSTQSNNLEKNSNVYRYTCLNQTEALWGVLGRWDIYVKNLTGCRIFGRAWKKRHLVVRDRQILLLDKDHIILTCVVGKGSGKSTTNKIMKREN